MIIISDEARPLSYKTKTTYFFKTKTCFFKDHQINLKKCSLIEKNHAGIIPVTEKKPAYYQLKFCFIQN